MTTIRFPLFRTPFLALRVILDYYSPYEIIQLSLCSKRSLRVVKQCRKRNGLVKADLSAKTNPKVILHFGESLYRFVIVEAKDVHNERTHNIRIGDAVVPSIHKGIETVTFWKDKIFGIGQILSYIKDIFDQPINSILLESEEHPNEFNRTIDCVMRRQESIKACRLHCDDSIDDCLAHLLDNLKITGELRISRGPSSQFRHNWNIHLDHLRISNDLCLTYQSLTNIDCRILETYRSRLTSKDLNLFLKNWQNGANYRLKMLSVVINSMDRETVTSGIDTVLQQRGFRRYYQGMDNREIEKCGGIDIRRNDGRIGTIFIYDRIFEFGVDPEVNRRPD